MGECAAQLASRKITAIKEQPFSPGIMGMRCEVEGTTVNARNNVECDAQFCQADRQDAPAIQRGVERNDKAAEILCVHLYINVITLPRHAWWLPRWLGSVGDS
jgi:hypothetical protein